MIHASAKFIVLDKIIDELVVKQKKKVLIFSGFTRMLDCCEDFLQLRGGSGEKFKFVRLDGGTSRARRNLGIRMFNREESEYRVMLISTRAGGLVRILNFKPTSLNMLLKLRVMYTISAPLSSPRYMLLVTLSSGNDSANSLTARALI